MFKVAIAILILWGTIHSLRAAPLQSPETNTEMALKLPLENRLRIFKTQGPSAVEDLKKIAFDETQSLDERWRAITVTGRVFPMEGREVLEQAMESKQWYLRNAAVISLKYSHRDWAITKAQALLNDPALVVRTSAVNTLKELGAIEAESLLWEKLYAAENFRNGQSLWIRKHIAEALVKFARNGQESSFMKMLRDDDKSLHESAVIALNRLSGKDNTRDQWLQR